MKRLRDILNLKEAVDDHVNNLFAAGTDHGKFTEAMDKIKSDKSLKSNDYNQILSNYRNKPTGGTYQYKSKNIEHAHRQIFDTFIERKESEEKRAILDKINKWPYQK